MSRSYKKNPVSKTGASGYRRFAKRLANKKVRRFKGMIANGQAYRKVYNSWDIYDYVSFCPLNQKPDFLSHHDWARDHKRK